MKTSLLTFFLVLALSWSSAVPADNPAVWPGAHQLTASRHAPVVDNKLQNATLDLPEKALVPVWIFFTDKGIFDNLTYNDRLALANASLTPAARERRMKSRGPDNLIDFRDLPVNTDYVEAVISTGAELRNISRWFNAVSVNASAEQINMISGFDFVRYIKGVSWAKTNLDLGLEPIPPDMNLVSLDYGASLGQLEQINAVVAHELGFKGQDVIVCMMDTGFKQQHDAFQNIINSGRLIAQYDFINHDDNVDYDPNQDSYGQPGHGTLTWSTLGGEASGHLYGPSYMAGFVLSKTEDITSERHIEEDNWAAGAEWADSIGASVISASLGYRWFDVGEGDYSYDDLDGNTTIVTNAADLAAYNGIAVATAMGNEGNTSGSLIAPADGDSVIACGAVDSNRNLAGFSSYGPTSDGRTKPEVCAQGVATVCVDPNNPHGYTSASGTSLSTPLVGGSCGVLLSAHPNWTPMMVREALMMTADRADTPDNHYGWGILDLGRALTYHPEGDIVFDHSPVLDALPGQPIPVQMTVTGGSSIGAAYLYYRGGDTGDFTEVTMNTSDNETFTGEIPGMQGSLVQYYFKAIDDNSSHAFYPLGGSLHPYSVYYGANSLEDSFEDGLIYWKSGGTNNMWGLTSNAANTGDVSISDSPTIYYYDNTDSWLESAFSLDLSGGPASMSFFYKGSLQSDRDYLYVEASTDGGSTWDQISDGISGVEFSFVQHEVSLNDYIGESDVKVRFHLVTDGSGRRDGINIDDVSIVWTTTGVDDDREILPSSISLNQNYPNPFNPSTQLSFSIPTKGQVDLAVYDLLGRKVNSVISAVMEPGAHEAEWNGKDQSGNDVASGIYLYRLQFEGTNLVKMMTLLR